MISSAECCFLFISFLPTNSQKSIQNNSRSGLIYRGRVTKRPSCALLKGMAFDGNDNRLQPSFCNKNGVRYHYYTSAKRLKDTKSDPHGMRIPAGDLERLVITAMADRLQDCEMMQHWLSRHIPIQEVPNRLKAISLLATAIGSEKQNQSEKIRLILERITVSKSSLQIRLSEYGLSQALDIPQIGGKQTGQTDLSERNAITPVDVILSNMYNKENPLLITMNSHLLRSGKQVKLILGNDMNESGKPNPRLAAMVAKTRHWFDGLKSGRYPTIKDTALEEKCDKSHIGRLMSIAFLAPDIVERILTGNHSATLTPERLRKACPLPWRWEHQRALLLQ